MDGEVCIRVFFSISFYIRHVHFFKVQTSDSEPPTFARKLSVLHVVLIIGFLGMVPANMFLVNLKDAQHEDGGTEVGQ